MFLNPDLVINKEEFKVIKDQVICVICQGILISPIQCSICHNSFCSSCFQKWKEEKGIIICPFKCQNSSFKTNKILNDLLSKLIFKCEKGCNEKIPYLDLEKHYQSHCPKIDYQKKYLECQKKCIENEKKYLEYKAKYLECNEKYNNLLRKYNQLDNKLENKNNKNKTFKSNFHEHELKDITLNPNNWFCNICNKCYKSQTEKRYGCDRCNFDLCSQCFFL